MVNRIVKILKECGITTYFINETTSESVELFFIKQTIDMNRMKKVTRYKVTVYRDFEKDGKAMRGSATANLYQTMSEEEIETTLKDAYYAASFVNNPYYALPTGSAEDKQIVSSKFNEKTLEESAKVLLKALFEYDTSKDARLNSGELFVYRLTCHYKNSEGIDVSYQKAHTEGEFVVQYVGEQDVEMHHSFYDEALRPEVLALKVKEALEIVRGRGKATQMPKAGEYNVILTHQHAQTLLSYYEEQSSSYMIYPKYSRFKVGDCMQGSETRGQKLNITLKATVPYSGEGIKMMDRPLLKEGVLATIHGGNRFAQYLGIEATGDYEAISVEPGDTAYEDMKAEGTLEIVSFSDFQMDSVTGDFGGEIRLAYYYTQGQVHFLTGGSIAGNIAKVQGDMILSQELYIERGSALPKAICLKGVTVAGA